MLGFQMTWLLVERGTVVCETNNYCIAHQLDTMTIAGVWTWVAWFVAQPAHNYIYSVHLWSQLSSINHEAVITNFLNVFVITCCMYEENEIRLRTLQNMKCNYRLWKLTKTHMITLRSFPQLFVVSQFPPGVIIVLPEHCGKNVVSRVMENIFVQVSLM